jgi:hypothetical protein
MEPNRERQTDPFEIYRPRNGQSSGFPGVNKTRVVWNAVVTFPISLEFLAEDP